MRRAVVALVLAGGCLISPPVQFGAGKSAEEAQQQMIGKLMPPTLAADDERTGEVTGVKVRVWADDEYRAQNVQWQHGFGETIEYANTVLGPLLGIRLEPEYHDWSRHAPGAQLEDDLSALAEQDPGEGATFVIGLTSALALTTATFEKLGVGSLPGKHVMLRGYADVDERRVFDLAFPKIPADEREAVHEARRRHKLASTLLHELGHNLGAPHDEEQDTLMNAMYSDRAATFDARSRSLMRATIDARLGRAQPAVAAAVAKPEPRHPQLMFAVTAAGDVTLGGQRLDADTIDDLLRRTLADEAETEVVVRMSHGAPRTRALEVLEHAKNAGYRRMSIVTAD